MPATTLAQLGDLSPGVRAALTALPDFSVGESLRAALRSAVQSAVQGRSPQLGMFGIPLSWADAFYPRRVKSAFADHLPSLVDLDMAVGVNHWVNPFASLGIAATCIAAQSLIPNLQIDTARAQADFDAGGAALFRNLARAYSTLFAQSWPDFVNASAQVDLSKTEYMTALRAGVNIRELWYAEGLWKHPEWELYHHWVKLLAMGATVAEIDAFIVELAALGLTIGEQVRAGVWQGYLGFFQSQTRLTVAEFAADGNPDLTNRHIEVIAPPPMGSRDPITAPVSDIVTFIIPSGTDQFGDPIEAGPGSHYFRA